MKNKKNKRKKNKRKKKSFVKNFKSYFYGEAKYLK